MAEVGEFGVEDDGSFSEPLPKHRVALVVFATVEGVDAQDASYVFERMLRNHLPRDEKLEATIVGHTWHGEIVYMMEAGTALRNGYMGAYPTRTAWAVAGAEDPGVGELR